MKKALWVFCCLALASPAAHAQKLTWSRIWGSTNTDVATDIVRDSAKNFYVSGWTVGSFDGETNSGGGAFVSKFDTNGVRLWTRIWGSSAGTTAAGVVCDAANNVYVCGQTAGDFHGETNTRAGTSDMFLTKWTSDGTWLWTRIWGATNDDDSAGVVCDAANDVYVGGTTYGSFGTAGQTNAKVGKEDFCLTKFLSDGSFQWSRIWGGTNSDSCYDIAKDPSADYIYLTGISYNGIFQGQTNYSAYNRLALSSYDTSGNHRWSRVWGATNRHNSARGVCANTYVYVTGSTFGSFDGEINYSPAYEDFFITKFDDTGTKNWTRIRGTNNIENAYGVAQVGGGVYVVGAAFANLDGQTRAGYSDFMIVKYDASGNWLWTRLWGSDKDEYSEDIALDGSNLYVCSVGHGNFGGQTNPGGSVWDSAVLTRWRQGPNVIPSASIQKPISGREFLVNETVLCAGTGNDTDDGALTNLLWRFGTNTSLGYGLTCTLNSAVSPGSQTVTVYAIDTEFATGKASVVVSVLQNSGGVPEVWQTNYWPNGDSGGATNDFDNDGLDNQSEWEGGSDPTNPLSVFECSDARGVPGTPQLVLQWTSVSNRDYAMSSSSNLPAGFSPLTSVPPTPPLNTYTTPASADPQIYYRVEVSR